MPYVIAAVVVLVLLGLWLIFGPGPRRSRAYRRAARMLEQGDWTGALRVVAVLQQAPRLPTAWRGRLRTLAGECHQRAADAALKEKRFEDGMEHARQAATLLGGNEADERARVLDAMLAECRRLFAAGTGTAETDATLQLLSRAFALQTPCPEASFWQALCLARQGHEEQALHALGLAHEQAGKQVLDPALYLGMLLHRQGKPQEGLRYLAEANRVDAGCPFVTWQMGLSMVAAGGDSHIALRALQRAVGPRGLPLWSAQPDRAWVEGFPEGKSYIRRLASRHPFVCPVLGNGLTVLIRLGQLALAQAHYRLGNFQEAADLFARLLQDSPPTVALLRGLGLSLARLERYDQAYKHLRIALEQENPKDAFTAGYLALCGALGKPTREEDKPSNVTWAIRLLARYPVTGNAEYAGLIGAVYAEARALNMELALEDQLQLCDTLASVHAADERAAASYAHLARTFPAAVRPEHAWLYARAATAAGYSSDRDLDLFGRTFRDSGPASAYFAQQEWSFEDAEYTYLERCARQAPGAFPEALGPGYAAQGEAFLLGRSHREEQAGRKDAAKACVEVLLSLAPDSIPGHDRLACLCYRRGELDQAAVLLSGWERLAPTDHWPLVRSAIIEQERGNPRRRAEAIDRALGLTRGRLRAAIAYLGARLALRDALPAGKSEQGMGKKKPLGNGQDQSEDSHPPFPLPHSPFEPPLSLLQECLKDDPDHVEALWVLAAVRLVMGDTEGLAAQAAGMNRPEVTDARFHFLGAVCHLAARDYPRVVELAHRAAEDSELAVESQFLIAWAHLHRQDTEAAAAALHKVAAEEHSPSAVHARALLGQLHFGRGAFDEAVRWWNGVDPGRRAAWGLDETLRQTVLLSGLLAFQDGRFDQAAERFREAGRLGLRDRRLGPLLSLALVRAGQRLLYEAAPAPPAPAVVAVDTLDVVAGGQLVALPRAEPTPQYALAAEKLERAVQAGCNDANVLYMLALAHKRQGKVAEARAALRKITRPDANVLLQLGLLSLQENNLPQAEGELLRAWEADKSSYEACYNLLLTQLTLGKLAACLSLVPLAVELAARRGGPQAAEEQRFLQVLQGLLQTCEQAADARAAGALLAELTPQDENRLLKIIRSLGNTETVHTLLRALSEARPRSAAVREAYVESVLVKAKELVDRCAWTDAELLLRPLAREKAASRTSQVALLNLLGCCACLTQDFEGAITHFSAALKLAGSDARLYQNLALTYEFKGDLTGADPYWNRYFDLLDERVPVPTDRERYRDLLTFESLNRLAVRYGEKEKWSSALAYLQRAQSLRPNDPDVLEHLFHLFRQAKRLQDARRSLDQLRRLRPEEPQYELYELELDEVKGLGDIERRLNDIDRIRRKYPGNKRVEEHAVNMVGNVVPLMGNLCDQLTQQMGKVMDQVRNLPNHQINWSAVREVMRDLLREFQKLRRITGKCLPLVTSEDHRRIIRDLSDHIDKKMEACRSMGA